MLTGISDKESDKYRNEEESALQNLFPFLKKHNDIDIYVCVPKTRLSAKRFIHPKFIFVRAHI